MSGDTGLYSKADLLGLGALIVFPKPFHLSSVADAYRRLFREPAPPSREEARSFQLA
jgi:hypothetical protein